MGKLFFGELKKPAGAVIAIMAGGSGTRFWPMSRKLCPKQYLKLADKTQSLIQATANRLEGLCENPALMVVTADSQRALVEEQLPTAAILAEPCPRNTAPCVGYAALKVLAELGDVPMLCLPSDSAIKGVEGLVDTYQRGIELARKSDTLVTIGIKPTLPETGYGYIERGEIIEEKLGAYAVKRFVEKPDKATAEQYLDSGEFFWNSGTFVWRPSVLLAQIAKHLPDLHERLMRVAEAFGTDDERELITAIFEGITPVSVDVGVMEQADNVAMLPGDSFSWSDVGSWSAWADYVGESECDAEGNIARADVMLESCKGSVVVGDKRFIAAIGLEDIVIVDTEDALLVCRKDASQDVKKIVDSLKEQKRDELL